MNDLKILVGAKKVAGTVITAATQENIIKKSFGKRFAIPPGFDFSSIQYILMRLEKIGL